MSKMDDFLANQQQIAQAIEHVFTNFKKDSSERKTADYIQRRLDILDKYWLEFKNNHARLSEFGIESNSYFTNQEFQRVAERYGSIRLRIQNYQPLTEERPRTPLLKPPTFVMREGESSRPSGQATGTSSRTDDMLKKQFSNFKAFQRTVVNIDLDSVSQKWEFDDLLRTVQTRWAAIDTLHWDLDSELEGSNKEYEDTFIRYESEYNRIKKAINRKMWSVAHREKSTPQMEIPTFSGSYNTWTSFKDLFTEIIHNNPSMSNAQKMQYLKTKVKGEAERLIQHLSISSDNYDVCWDILNQRFNNKRLIFSSHISLLLNIPVMPHQSLNHIKRIHDTTIECLNAIKNLGVDVSSWDPLIVYILSQKLDTESYTDYIESVKHPRELPMLNEFLDFLETKFTTLESARRKQDNPTQKYQGNLKVVNNSNQKPNYYKNSFSSSIRMTPKQSNGKNIMTKNKCSLCNSDDHGIYFCQNFLNMSPSSRRKMVAKLNLCPNCLYNHYGKACISNRRCRECNKDHNSLLHETIKQTSIATPDTAAEGVGPSGASSSNAYSGKNVKSSSHVSFPNEPIEVLLPTAIIKVESADGTLHKMRCLLDQGSQTSLITERAAQLLRLPRRSCKGVISGVGDKESNCKGLITIQCSSLITDFKYKTEALIMKSLIKNLPSYTFSKPDWTYLDHIKLADPEFYVCRPVDILLGADVYSAILLDGICRVNSSLPTAQQTQLGWILSGNVKTFQCNVVLHNYEDIYKFWELEDISKPAEISSEDQRCLQYYQATTKRRENGRYEVRLPMKPNYQENLGHSKNKAIGQFFKLEQKFQKQPDIAQQYKLFINEYLSLGHMIPVDKDSHMTPECFLPHHCVERPESETTQLRVVFNGKSKTSSGFSLNDLMCRGPNLQQDLQSLIIKWRQFQFAFTADIEKMFRQIWLNPEDSKLQKIIWRDDPSKNLKAYQLSTVTYGTKAAPFLAMCTIKQLARDERPNYQESSAPRVLEESFYMDDLIHGAHSIESAKRLKKDLSSLLSSGGFNLRKWKSNLPDLLENATAEKNYQGNFDFKQAESTKTLGLGWNPQGDYFNFTSKLTTSLSRPTKRIMLSEISKQYDPMGWIAPLTTKLKILFQDTWKVDIKWDEYVPNDIHLQWNEIRADIEQIKCYQVPRWLGTRDKDSIELHGFCDASTKAYACVVYCKIQRGNSSSITLVAAKTKLVPLKKTVSLPRLELSGALLLSKLMVKITSNLSSYEIKIYGWVDSTAVLGWLHGDPERWKPFVANRVKQITASMPPECWRYVKSKENPADCASRGLNASQLRDHTLWWQGPNWLTSFRQENKKQAEYTTDQEMRKLKSVSVTQVAFKREIIQHLLKSYSSLSKCVKVLGWILRFIYRKSKENYLSVSELQVAKVLIIKHVQQEEFYKEIKDLRARNSVNSRSKLYELNPMLDKDGVLRVGGRLRNANLDPETKHPAIIPRHSRLAILIIDEAHELTYHGGARLTTAFMRRKYWMLGGIRTTKSRLRHCVKCRRHTPDQNYQLMGDLPSARSNPSRSFFHTGVDYSGFVSVKANKGRGGKTTKGYIVVFVCMATKAVHLELASDLTASAFLAALRRMAARRGTPGHIYSDQGRNFIGANNILQREYSAIQEIFSPNFKSEVASLGIEWHFNAPAWPSAGGLWEAAVKSLKYHLKRVVGEQALTFEEYSTLLSQLEGCLNSRPLCALTEDPNDLDVLTPAHFLSSGPMLNIYDTETDLRTRWYLIQKIFNDVWERWRNEYLTQLAARNKWRKPQPNIKENDIVIIRDENLPSGKWPLGRVVQLHPGNDGYVRVVTLRTKNGILQRPIVRLSILPVEQNQEGTSSPTEKQNQENENKSIPKSSRRKQYCLTSMIKSLLLFFIAIIPTVQCSYNITPLQNISLYFDTITSMHLIRDDWRLVVYYDTFPYQEGNTALTKYIQYLNNMCVIMKARSHCEEILLQLRHEFTELQYYNNILTIQHDNILETRPRRRRGLINGVGSIANSLFGILDESFAEKYEKDIELIKRNQNHLATLWKNQTTVVEAEFNLLKRTKEIMEKNHKNINRKIISLENSEDQFQRELQNISFTSEFISTAMLTSNLIISLRNIQQNLLDTITNIYNGKFNFHLLSPNQLRQELNVIAGQLPKDLSLPIDNSNSYEIYNLLQVRARIRSNYIIFEIKIPLISRDMFEVLEVIPVPYISENKEEISVVPVSRYIAINLKKDSLVPLTEKDLDLCTRRDPKFILCHHKRPIYYIKDDHSFCENLPFSRKCKTVTRPCYNRWIELNKLNIYFYFCCDQCKMKLLCDDQVTAVQLTRSGLFNVDQGCIVKAADFLVYSHRLELSEMNISSDIQAPKISPINHIINISLPDRSLPNNTNDDIANNLQMIKEQIEFMKKNEPLAERVSYHDVHHYAAIYVLFAVVAVGALVYSWRRCRRSAPGAPAEAGVSVPMTEQEASSPHVLPSVSAQCSECFRGNQCQSVSANDFSKKNARVFKQNRSTSPVLRSVYAIPNQCTKTSLR